jgi:hypothetical protein
MAASRTFAVNDAAEANVVVQTPCKRVTVRQNVDAAAMIAYTALRPLSTSPAIPMAASEPCVFDADPPSQIFFTGQVAGTVRLVAGGGATTFSQWED